MKKIFGKLKKKPQPNKKSKKTNNWKTKYSIKFPCTVVTCKLKSNLLLTALTFPLNTCECAMEHMANH